MTHERAFFTFRTVVTAVTLGAVAGIAAMYGACTAADDTQSDVSGCTLEACLSACIAIGEPQGECVDTEAGVRCFCHGATPDADADGDGEADGDGAPDRVEVREDAPVDVADEGETVEETDVREDGDAEGLREDRVAESLPREEVLKNAPAHTLGFFRVPKVIPSAEKKG